MLKHYDAEEKVLGKTMREHLRFSVVYWHTFRNGGHDPFGVDPTIERPWMTDRVESNALRRNECSKFFPNWMLITTRFTTWM